MKAAAGALVVVWALATTLGPTASVAINDLGLYEAYGGRILDGRIPYRDFDLEYPPVALVPMALAAAVGTGAAFEWAFGTLMLASMLLVQREAARLAGARGHRVAWVLVVLPVAAGAIVRARFDLFVVALALLGLRLALEAERLGARGARCRAGLATC